MEEGSSGTKQALIAIADDWSHCTGKLYCYENNGFWKQVNGPFPAVFGEKGLIRAEEKREGDRRSPTGIFKLGTAYGHAPKVSTKLKYLKIENDLEAVDDPDSAYYNHVIRRSEVKYPDWKSSEPMHLIDVYDVAVFIEHNWPKVEPLGGSAIFLHQWTKPNVGTAGCTALDKSHLAAVVEWLDCKKQPVLIQGVNSQFCSVPIL